MTAEDAIEDAEYRAMVTGEAFAIVDTVQGLQVLLAETVATGEALEIIRPVERGFYG